MFLINSRWNRFTVACLRRHPLSRTYGAILQSSLTTVLPSALVYSTRLPVSVLVRSVCFNPRSFSRTSFLQLPPKGPSTTLYHASILTLANSVASTDISSRLLAIWTPSLHQSTHWGRNINLLPIVYAFRPRLRDRLTLGGITFPRKP